MLVKTKLAMGDFLTFAIVMAILVLLWISRPQMMPMNQTAIEEVDRIIYREILRRDEANARAGRLERTSSYVYSRRNYATKEDRLLMRIRSMPVREPPQNALEVQAVEAIHSEQSPIDSNGE